MVSSSPHSRGGKINREMERKWNNLLPFSVVGSKVNISVFFTHSYYHVYSFLSSIQNNYWSQCLVSKFSEDTFYCFYLFLNLYSHRQLMSGLLPFKVVKFPYPLTLITPKFANKNWIFFFFLKIRITMCTHKYVQIRWKLFVTIFLHWITWIENFHLLRRFVSAFMWMHSIYF